MAADALLTEGILIAIQATLILE